MSTVVVIFAVLWWTIQCNNIPVTTVTDLQAITKQKVPLRSLFWIYQPLSWYRRCYLGALIVEEVSVWCFDSLLVSALPHLWAVKSVQQSSSEICVSENTLTLGNILKLRFLLVCELCIFPTSPCPVHSKLISHIFKLPSALKVDRKRPLLCSTCFQTVFYQSLAARWPMYV